MWTSPTHAGMKAFLMTRAGDVMMLAGMFLIFMHAGTFGFTELPKIQHGRSQCRSKNLLVLQRPALWRGSRQVSAVPAQRMAPEAMTGPTAVSALIHAATMVKAGVFLVARIGPLFFALASAGAFSVEQFFEVMLHGSVRSLRSCLLLRRW